MVLSRGDQQEGGEDGHDEAGEDEGAGGEGGGEQHAGKTGRRLVRSCQGKYSARTYRPARKQEK